ncbi:MAG: hypothetical protein COX62_07905 [Deltaproteobacteria bacterium CG_4_10_14_0_2_um_filter_43_8]|nr:MAG: hypothetical protein COV43_05330 [Deltaproteobacteria bacterium CG11_big_fil_rev_8_21_14_0_20_42_23]PJA18874.1 MAG: hypothetical protein COX62_07905 [Deltaproteobacteria bacterium CG_4_10_14_0_2_um_filter_43_8]PJC64014.1 MAG: hypothetical protein CO021_06305 [Deltaproteobacteria bacterium CG_4_9_14_0_2_um_filter_42_21]
MPKRKSQLEAKTSTQGQMGYPEIEKLIDSEHFDEVNGAFSRAYDELVEVERKKKGLKKGKDAAKGMLSIELTMELFRELLSLKYQLQEELKKKHQQTHAK